VTAPLVVTQQAAGAATQSQLNFELSNLDNVANLQAVWDQYRIDAVTVTIKPQNNAIGMVTNSTTTLVDFYSVIDYDNSTALGSVAAARAYDNCVIQSPAESCSRTFVPRIAVAAYSGAFTSFANMPPEWLDSASPNVAHYGLKTYVPGGAAGQVLLQTWEITFELWVSFRSIF